MSRLEVLYRLQCWWAGSTGSGGVGLVRKESHKRRKRLDETRSHNHDVTCRS